MNQFNILCINLYILTFIENIKTDFFLNDLKNSTILMSIYKFKCPNILVYLLKKELVT